MELIQTTNQMTWRLLKAFLPAVPHTFANHPKFTNSTDSFPKHQSALFIKNIQKLRTYVRASTNNGFWSESMIKPVTKRIPESPSSQQRQKGLWVQKGKHMFHSPTSLHHHWYWIFCHLTFLYVKPFCKINFAVPKPTPDLDMPTFWTIVSTINA